MVNNFRRLQADANFRICRSVSDYPQVLKKSRTQAGEPSYYLRGHPADGRMDPDQSLRAQYSLLRVSDNQRYPAWFEIESVKYALKIEEH